MNMVDFGFLGAFCFITGVKENIFVFNYFLMTRLFYSYNVGLCAMNIYPLLWLCLLFFIYTRPYYIDVLENGVV